MTLRFGRVLLFGLTGIVWFCALFQAAYDVWAAAIVYFLGSVLVLSYACWNYRRNIATHLPLAPFSFLVLTAAWCSVYHAYDRDTAILEAWGWTFSLSFFYLLLNILEEKNDLDQFLDISGLIMLPLAAICIWQRCTGHPDSWGHWEIKATLINSLVLSGFALYWVFWFIDRARQGNRLALVSFISCIIVLVSARSWWAYVCLFIGFVINNREPLTRWYLRHKRVSLGLTAVFVGLFAFIVIKKVSVHAGPYMGSSRLYYWLAAMKIWQLEPWSGVGLGGFATAYPYVKTPGIQSTLFAHCFPLQWASETGLFGSLAMILFGLSVLRILRQNVTTRNDSSREASLKITIIVVLLFSLISINLEYLLNKVLLLFLLAGALGSHASPRYRIKPLWVLTFSVSLCLLSPFWLRLFYGSQSYMRGVNYERVGNIPFAKEAYLASVSIDPYYAESYHALSRLFWRQFQDRGSSQDRTLAINYLQKAMEHHKRRSYLDDLNVYTTESASLKKS